MADVPEGLLHSETSQMRPASWGMPHCPFCRMRLEPWHLSRSKLVALPESVQAALGQSAWLHALIQSPLEASHLFTLKTPLSLSVTEVSYDLPPHPPGWGLSQQGLVILLTRIQATQRVPSSGHSAGAR